MKIKVIVLKLVLENKILNIMFIHLSKIDRSKGDFERT